MISTKTNRFEATVGGLPGGWEAADEQQKQLRFTIYTHVFDLSIEKTQTKTEEDVDNSGEKKNNLQNRFQPGGGGMGEKEKKQNQNSEDPSGSIRDITHNLIQDSKTLTLVPCVVFHEDWHGYDPESI